MSLQEPDRCEHPAVIVVGLGEAELQAIVTPESRLGKAKQASGCKRLSHA
jgi:hypothetical protein